MFQAREVMTNVQERSQSSTIAKRIRSPRIRMVTPGFNFVVAGSVFILIDAASDVDPMGSLKVEIRIDRTTCIEATYSPASGYYGAIWDSSALRSGTMHSLTAEVFDSAGNSKSTHAIVSVG